MSTRPFRFLHASDFRLEAVPRGLTEVPDHLRDILLDAPYAAARRVFDIAMADRVDFVILAGNLLRADLTGPRGIAFIGEQLARLAEAEIAVYWAGGENDPPEAWPSALPLPDTVRVFPKDRVTDFLHQADGTPLARIVGASLGAREFHVAEFLPDAVGLFTIGAVCGEVEAASLLSQNETSDSHPTHRIKYWALGGRPDRSTLFHSPSIAHYPGTPQGRGPDEAGPHGCTIVSVDDQGRARMSYNTCNALEWLAETVSIDATTNRERLEAIFSQRIHALTAGSKADRLVNWTIAGSGPLLTELRRGKLRSELLDWLRIEHGLSSPAVWTVAIDVERKDALPESLYDQKTILGDYLCEVREFEEDPERSLHLDSLLTDEQAAGEFSNAATVDAATRKRVLHEAALLGMELLGGEPAQ